MTPVFELNHLQVSLRGKKQNMDLVKGVSFSVDVYKRQIICDICNTNCNNGVVCLMHHDT